MPHRLPADQPRRMPNLPLVATSTIVLQALAPPAPVAPPPGPGVAGVAIAVALLITVAAVVAGTFARIGLRAHAEAAERERELRRQAEIAQSESQRFATELQEHAARLEVQTDEARALAAELRTAEERLRLAVSSADIGTWECDPRSLTLECSDRCRAAFGLGPDSDVSYDVFRERLHPDDRATAESKIRAALDPRGDGDLRAESRALWPDGTIRWIDARGRAFFEGAGDERHAVRFTGTVFDITPRMRAEEAFRDEARLVETIQRIGSVVTAELDIERLMQRVTDEATAFTGAEFGAFLYDAVDPNGEPYALYSMAGVPRPGELRGPRRTTAHVPALGEDSGYIVRSADIARDSRYPQTTPFHGMLEEHLPVRSYLAVPVISRTGGVLGRLFFGHSLPAIFTDRDERVATGIAAWASVAMDNARLYEEERGARAEAQAANRVKSDFLTSMSHELRTPLNAIAGYTEILSMGVRGPVTTEQREDLARIQRNQRHLLSLINDILNFARDRKSVV